MSSNSSKSETTTATNLTNSTTEAMHSSMSNSQPPTMSQVLSPINEGIPVSTQALNSRNSKGSKIVNAEETINSIDSNVNQMNKIRLLYFFYRVSTASLIPFMSIYMQHSGWSSDQIGRLQSIRPIMTLISAPLWGALADRTGRKRLILMSTFVSSAVCRLAVRFTEGNIVALAFALCATSTLYAPCTPLLDSIVVTTIKKEDRPNFGRLRLWGELGNGISSATMMYFLNSEWFGFDFLFLVHAISTIIALIFMQSCVPKDKNLCASNKKDNQQDIKTQNTRASQREVDWETGLRTVLGSSQILSLFGLVTVAGYSLGFMENFCYINIRQLYKKYGQTDIAGRDISLCRVFMCLGGITSWFFSGAWTKKLGPDLTMIIAICCLPLCLILYSGIGFELDKWTKIGFFLAEALRAGVFAALWSTATVRLNNISPCNMKAVMATLMDSTYRGVGHTSGSFFGGILCQKYGDVSIAFLVAGKRLLSFLCTVGTLFFMSPKK